MITACPAAEHYLPEPAEATLVVPSVSPEEPARTWAAPGTGVVENPEIDATDETAPDGAASATTKNEPAAKPQRRDRSSRRQQTSQPRARAADSPSVSAPIEERTPPAQPASPAPEQADADRPALALFTEEPNAPEPEPVGKTPSQSPGEMAGMLLGLGLKLGLVIALAYLCALALRKVAQRRGALKIGGGILRVVETATLAPNRGLHIVSVGNRAFLVGSTPEQFSVLGEVSQVPEVSRLTEARSAPRTLAAQLRQWLGRSVPSRTSRDPTIERLRAGADALRERSAQAAPRFDGVLQAAIDEANRR